MTSPPGYYTTAEVKAILKLSHQRIIEIAKTYDWDGYRVGRNWLWAERDVDIHAQRMEAQRAWELLKIPNSQWATAELSDMNDVGAFECPACGEMAYSPAPGSEYDHMAACPSCGWKEKERR